MQPGSIASDRHRSTLDLDADATSPALARSFVVDRLTEWGCHHLLEVGALLTSELVTNVILHAATPARLSVALTPTQVLRIEVYDEAADRPPRPTLPGTSTQGRGLALVAALASRWGVERHDGGKAVWVELR